MCIRDRVKIEDIIPNMYQPRKYFKEEALAELSQSIKEYGIIPVSYTHLDVYKRQGECIYLWFID